VRENLVDPPWPNVPPGLERKVLSGFPYAGGPFPASAPSLFESEAHYLKRHALLLPRELEALRDDALEPEEYYEPEHLSMWDFDPDEDPRLDTRDASRYSTGWKPSASSGHDADEDEDRELWRGVE
jgi:hypothetical protein